MMMVNDEDTKLPKSVYVKREEHDSQEQRYKDIYEVLSASAIVSMDTN